MIFYTYAKQYRAHLKILYEPNLCNFLSFSELQFYYYFYLYSLCHIYYTWLYVIFQLYFYLFLLSLYIWQLDMTRHLNFERVREIKNYLYIISNYTRYILFLLNPYFFQYLLNFFWDFFSGKVKFWFSWDGYFIQILT